MAIITDGIHTAALSETAAAFDVAETECTDHTSGEYGFIATLGQAEERFRLMGEGGDVEAIAVSHAIQIVFALMNDVNL